MPGQALLPATTEGPPGHPGLHGPRTEGGDARGTEETGSDTDEDRNTQDHVKPASVAASP